MSTPTGPLPQWRQVFEAEDSNGVTWRLWMVEDPAPADPFPRGYRLAPRDEPEKATFITREHGLYHALDSAGLRIAGDAVRRDPDGARRQRGLDGDHD